MLSDSTASAEEYDYDPACPYCGFCSICEKRHHDPCDREGT